MSGEDPTTHAVRLTASLPSLLHPCTEGRREVAFSASPATLRGAVDALLSAYPLLRPHLLDQDGALRRHVNLFLGDQDVRWLESWDEPVRDGDTLIVLQNVSGG